MNGLGTPLRSSSVSLQRYYNTAKLSAERSLHMRRNGCRGGPILTEQPVLTAQPVLSALIVVVLGSLGCSPKISVGHRDADGHPTELVRMAAARNSASENGLRMAEAGDYRAAAQAFREAVRQDPDDDRAYYNLGLMLEKLGDYLGARDAYRRAGEIDNRSKYLEAQLRAQSQLIRINNRTAEAFAVGRPGANGSVVHPAREERFHLRPLWDGMKRQPPPAEALRLPDDTVPPEPEKKRFSSPQPAGPLPPPHPPVTTGNTSRPDVPAPSPPGSADPVSAKPLPSKPASIISAPTTPAELRAIGPRPSELKLDPTISPVLPPAKPATNPAPAVPPVTVEPTQSSTTPAAAMGVRQPPRVLILAAAPQRPPAEWESILARAAEDVEWQLHQRGRVALIDRADLAEELAAEMTSLASNASVEAVAQIGRLAGAAVVVLISAELTQSPVLPNRLDGTARARLIFVADSPWELPALLGSGSAAGDAPDSVARTAVGLACVKLAEQLPAAVAGR